MLERLFRLFLKLLPSEFRADYGREMEATFRAEESAVRGAGRLRLWAATLADIFRTAPAEHWDILVRDLRFAGRTMARRPLHGATAVVTLALGISVNVAMFAVIQTVLLAPLPYREADALVTVQEQQQGREPGNMGYLTFADLRDRVRTLSSMAAASQSFATLSGDGLDPERVSAMRVSASYFEMIGVSPALGRGFTEAEDRPGAARRVVILSDTLWRRRFGADPAVIGRPISVGTETNVVVGVMPRQFEDLVADRLYEGAELWFPLGYDPAAAFACRTCRHLRVLGRLAPGHTTESAAREMTAIMGGLALEHPAQYRAPSIAVRTLSEFFLGPVRPVLLVLWAGVAMLLLVACANVANLQLLNATERTHEVAVRLALGVTRARLGRQLMTEALLLAALGGAGGLALASVCLRVVSVIGPAQFPRLDSVAMDPAVVLAAFLITVVSGLAFGLVPLRKMGHRDAAGELSGAGRKTDSTSAWRSRALLVGGNVAMAAVLLVTSGLLVRSTLGLLAVEPGFDADRVLTMRVVLGGVRYSSGPPDAQIAAVTSFYGQVLERVRGLPGVESASAVSTLPLGGGRDEFGLHIAGRLHDNPEEAPDAARFVVQDDFFDVLKVPVVRGRVFDARDGVGATRVAVINRAAAEALFPEENPIGHQLMLGPPNAPPRTIVGIVGDVRHDGLDAEPGYQVYVPHAQWAWAEPMMSIVVRTSGAPLQMAGAVRQAVRDIDAAQPVTDVREYASLTGESTSTRRFAAGLLAGFALTALVLTVVGLYGALGVVIRQRQREIGIRLALGAATGDIRRMVVAQGMKPVAVGLSMGLLLAFTSAGVLRTLLYGVEARDPLTFALAAGVLCAASLAACLVPAFRGASVDPVTALRS
jgi:putative ABC transport system permease protein